MIIYQVLLIEGNAYEHYSYPLGFFLSQKAARRLIQANRRERVMEYIGWQKEAGSYGNGEPIKDFSAKHALTTLQIRYKIVEVLVEEEWGSSER